MMEKLGKLWITLLLLLFPAILSVMYGETEDVPFFTVIGLVIMFSFVGLSCGLIFYAIWSL